MKILIYIILASLCINSSSQINDLDNYSIRTDASLNIPNQNGYFLPTLRTSLSYDFSKFQISGGFVYTSKLKDIDPSYNTDLEWKLGLAGGVVNIKYYRKRTRKKSSYYFFENMYLNYHTNQGLGYVAYNPRVHFINSEDLSNMSTVIQPVIGNGLERRVLYNIFFSLEYGFGIIYRKFKYDDKFISSSNNPNKLKNVIGQLKIGIGYNF